MAVDTPRYKTNQDYRLVTAEDLKVGREIILVDLGTVNRRKPEPEQAYVFDDGDPRIPNTVVRITRVSDGRAWFEARADGNSWYYWIGTFREDANACLLRTSHLYANDYPAVFIIAVKASDPVPA